MSNELKEIKERILEEGKVEALLEAMDCEYITLRRNRYEAKLPNKFNSPNRRSVQVYLNDHLSSRIRTLGESELDIYGLVSYIVFESYTHQEQSNTLHKAKKWICEQLNYSEFLNSGYAPPKKNNQLSWLRSIKRERKKVRELPEYENEIYDEDILNQFVLLPHQKYYEEGVDYKTQIEFGIGYDIRSQRIIFPIHNRYGEIVSIKGRTIYDDYEDRDIYKFMYLINFNKMIEWYNWHRALYYIIEQKEVIIFEAEKTCWLSSQFGYRNCLAISGDDISEFQANMIKELGLDINIVIAMDKDKPVEAIKKQAAKFGKTRNVYALFDNKNMYKDRESPCDLGRDTFKQLYEESKFKIPM
ncbi:DNA primase [Paenibacillus silvae]|uniref:DNA primase n=1 Tax=Paenibacillus silvae TaxID=1325358 RepID=A0A2W6NNM3_9BACL|nr:DNA primase [Paenibacillus silvae]PZT57365.1 DNA primase [Paenibacillus silvae]